MSSLLDSPFVSTRILIPSKASTALTFAQSEVVTQPDVVAQSIEAVGQPEDAPRPKTVTQPDLVATITF